MPKTSNNTLILRSIAIASVLTIIKVSVFGLTNSLAILASGADSLMDVLVSLANFILLRSSSKPADDNHPYGHGKIETLAGLIQSLVLGAMTLGIGAMSVKRLISPQQIHETYLGIGITVLALAFNLWHTRNLRISMISTGSQLMATEHLHFMTDTLMYVGVLLALGLTKLTGQMFWDPFISILFVIYLMKNVASLFRDTMSDLLDTSLPTNILEEIDVTVRGFHPNVTGYHDLRTRKVGPTKFIEFHVELKEIESFREAHHLTERLVDRLKEKYPDSVVTVHSDPHGAD